MAYACEEHKIVFLGELKAGWSAAIRESLSAPWPRAAFRPLQPSVACRRCATEAPMGERRFPG
jgi:hypothetical protein